MMISTLRKFTFNPIQILMVCFALEAPIALAHSDIENPAVLKRIHAMEAMEEAHLTLSDMAQGRRGFDELVAERARGTLTRQSAALPKLFKSPQMDPKTTALPTIWDNWNDFKNKSNGMKQASKRLKISSPADLKSSLSILEAACNACHKVYRQSGE